MKYDEANVQLKVFKYQTNTKQSQFSFHLQNQITYIATIHA
uniref:Uncharacterized protein n=1 Tax=Rhizophora mucronata TaxID=61149 RepID=A0A2P2N3U9_RHIMU